MNLLRQLLKRLYFFLILFGVQSRLSSRNLKGEQVADNELGAVCLGGGYGNFRSRTGIEHMVGFSGNGGSQDIHDGQNRQTLFLCQSEGGNRIRGLSGLGNHDHHTAFLQLGVPVAEFACHIAFYRNVGQVFNHIFGDQTHMIGRTAGDKIESGDLFQLLPVQSAFGEVNLPFFHIGRQRILDRLRLLVDFLEHVMLIAAFFRRFRVPLDLYRLLADFFPIDIVEVDGIL